ncbi:cytochrome c3 family protein [Thermodesulfobacteriota bacterium]
MFKVRVGLLVMVLIFVVGLMTEFAGQNANAGDRYGLQESDAEMCVPMGEVILVPPESGKQKRSSVHFPHSRHFSYECKTCHHKWKGDVQIQNCTTSGCHDLKKAPKEQTKYLVYPDSAIKYFKYAFHSQCIGCHKEIKTKRRSLEMSYQTLKTELPKTGPTGCNKCHPKE